MSAERDQSNQRGIWADVQPEPGSENQRAGSGLQPQGYEPGEQHGWAYRTMLKDQRQQAKVRQEICTRKAETARLAADNINMIQIFNVKYKANAASVAAAFNRVYNGVTHVSLNRKREHQARIPKECPHNGSGLVTFNSPKTVRMLIERAPLKEIKGRMVWVMYTDVADNGVLHVKPYLSPDQANGKTKATDKLPGDLLLKGNCFELCNWTAPSRLVVLHSEPVSIDLNALDSKFCWSFQQGGSSYKFELAYKYLSGKAELHSPSNRPPYLLFNLRIPPKIERIPPPTDPEDLVNGTNKDMTASEVQRMLITTREVEREKELQWSAIETGYIRTTDYTAEGYLAQCFVYRIQIAEEWSSRERMQDIYTRLRKLYMLNKHARPVIEVPRNLPEERRCEELFVTLSFNVWYHLECLLTSGLLSMQQVTQFLVSDLKDARIPEEVTCQALALLLSARSKLVYPGKQLRHMIRAIMYDGRKMQDLGRELPKYCMLVRRCVITPTRVVRLPPETELSNRILRRYKSHADRFIRVSFGDEDNSTLHLGGRWTSNDLIQRITKLLKEGIRVGGRTFQFLAFSTSQLRDQSVWCFSPLPFLSADQIRKEMGNFTHIRCVAKYAARMGQCFSSTVATVELQDDDFTRIQDVERNGFLFSDGCGLISEELADSVANVLKMEGRISLGIHRNPSAYQIRFGGCKGIVICYPDRPELSEPLTGRRMLIRPSMEKFTSDGRNIELVGTSRHHPAFLNRQIIVLLLGLGIQESVFQDLQDAMLKTLEGIQTSARQARQVLQDYGNIGSDEVLNSLLSMIAAGFDVNTEPYIKGLLVTIRGHLLQELKNRTRIFVDEAAVLMGTMDELGVLKEGEIFVQISPGPLQENPRVITGYTIVTKNPAFHPGDIRKLKAVDVPELRHLHNLVVYSQYGARPPANEISGSDLDGDMFFCCWDKRLVPARAYPAMDYSSPVAKELNRDVVIQDVADFFVDHAISDNLGIIANAHLAMADQLKEGVRDKKCLALAQLHSDAVDFPKTGKVVEIPVELKPTQVPDFMQSKHKKTYKSESIIGRLYREIQVPENLIGQLVVDCDEDLLCDSYNDFVPEAWNSRLEYEQQLIQIMSQFSVTDEFQLISGCIIHWDKLYKRRTGKRYDTKTHITEAVQALQKKFMRIFDTELREAYPDVEQRQAKAIEKASAWYYVTYHPQPRGETGVSHDEPAGVQKPHLISFAWIPGRYLTELKQQKRAAKEQETS